MRHVTVLLVAAFAALFSAPLQQDPPVPPRRVIGLVEIPRLFGADGDQRLSDSAVMLFHEPSERSTAAVTVRSRDDIEVREHGYERLSAVAYERRAGWYLLRAKRDRFAWLLPKDAGEFRPYPQLLSESLSFLTVDWDRALHDRPGGRIARRVPTQPDPSTGDPDWTFGNEARRPNDVSIVELRQHQGLWWVHVRVGPSICESGTDTPPVIAEGWVPAYSKAGNPTLWFYSRGC